MMRVLSPIYPPDVKPVRDGWYLTRQLDGPWFWALIEWRDSKWICPVRMDMIEQRRFWRGLAFDPAAAEPCDIDAGWMRIVGRDGVFVPGSTCE